MENYIVSARKYRPMSFDSVVGQSALTTTLKNAVKSGKLAHAYLFCGPRGVGKTTCARIFAKAINCEHPLEDGEVCNECESCKSFNEQRSYNIFELDAASNNSVENIKSLMEQTRIPPQVGKYKVFIIDEVHMLSSQAFNAFLKTLEEPPAHVVFILATTEKHKILPTILSRCQIYDFERMTVQGIIGHLKTVAEKEGITYEEQALALIAEKADGGMRDALSIFDQAASFCQGDITYEKVIEDLNVLDADYYFRIIDLALENKVSEIMVLLNTIIGKGFDGGHLINGLASHVRNVLMAKDPQTLPLLEVSDQQRQRYQEQAQKCPTPFMYKALAIMNQCDVNYRQSSNKRLLVELTLIQVAQITQPEEEGASAGRSPKRLKSLFKKLLTLQQRQAASQGTAAEKTATREAAAYDAQKNVAKPAGPQEAPMPRPTENDAPKKTPSAAPKAGRIGITFANILGNDKQSNTPATDDFLSSILGKKNFTQDQLEQQWYSMCNRMIEQHVATGARMKNLCPRITTTPNVEVVVDNQILLDEIQKIKNRIRLTLAQKLENEDLTLNVRLAKEEEARKVLTKRELFDELLKEKPALEKLRLSLHLELT